MLNIKNPFSGITYLRHISEFEKKEIEMNPIKIDILYKKNQWHKLPGTTFKVRERGYQKHAKKVYSKESLYDVIQVFKYPSKKKVLDPDHLLNHLNFRKMNTKIKLPQYLVFNILIPNYKPSWIDSRADGWTMMIVSVAEITKSCENRWLNNDKSIVADELLRKFLYDSETKKTTYENIRRRLKCINQQLNFDSRKFPFSFICSNLIQKYNGVPFLIKDSSIFNIHQGYVCIDIDVNKFGNIAKNGLWQLSNFSHNAIFDICLIIEGDKNSDTSELPENVICAWRQSRTEIFPNSTIFKSLD